MTAGIVYAEDWELRSRERLKAAKALAAKRLWADAFDLAGYSVEFALKCRIMREGSMNRWPERSARPDLYTHDLVELLRIAGLTAEVTALVLDGSELGKAWMIAKDWSPEIRYSDGRFPSRRARDMLSAIDEWGLLRWLLRV